MSAARKILWIDAGAGASGDMLLGALVDAGVPVATIRSAAAALGIEGWSVEASRVVRCGLSAGRVEVLVDDPHATRHWANIEELFAASSLAAPVRERALAVFRRLFEAEAAVHDRPFEEVHLHEAGALDALIDIAGTCAAVEHLGVDEIVVSRMTTGFGEVRCRHGVYPVPAPATARLVRGAPVDGGSIASERLTPTGAALLTTLADRWGPLPRMRPSAVGHGAGSRELEGVPNVLRVMLGESEPDPCEARGEVAVLECTLDDITPQALAFATTRLLDAGALDVFTSPVTMKKGRQGMHLTVLARPDDATRLAAVVLEQTSTLGVRYRVERRFELDREIVGVETAFGPVRMKVARLANGPARAWPEYDDCVELAERHGVPLAEVQRAALVAHARSREDT